MRFLLAGLILIAAVSSARAQTVIHDTNKLLPQIRAFAKQLPFQNAFQCNDKAQYAAHVISCSELNCSKDGCWSMCDTVSDPAGFPIERSVVNCTDAGAQIFINETGDISDVSRADYEGVGNSNAVELFLSDLGKYTGFMSAQVFITKVEPTTYTLARGTPQQRAVNAMHVHFDFGENNGNAKFRSFITVIEAAPGVAQIARLRTDSLTWFLLKDFPARR